MNNLNHTIRKFNRFELKYIITLKQAEKFKQALRAYMIPDEHGLDNGRYALASLYYDSPALRCYWEKEYGIRFRRKLRLRRYESGESLTEETPIFVEIKQRVDRVTQKRRAVLTYREALRLCNDRQMPDYEPEDKAVIEEIYVFLWQYNLRPVSLVRYDRQAFVGSAYERGVRHILVPGDVSAGIYGYRGHHLDQVPGAAPESRATAFRATRNQIFLADVYFPKKDGLTYYMLGGNHDYWHITNAGIDLVYMLCNGRKDMVYLGYDAADVPLTDKADVRLWHPTGGVPYALSYRTQKGLENMAFQELAEAVYKQKTPNMRMLIAGHLHIEVKFQRGPFVAAQIGCFEGQTNYLKKKGLYPEVGGAIFDMKITDGGVIQETGYTFMNFQEIADDWQNWPIPEDEPVIPDLDEVDVLFKFVDYQEAV